MKAMLGISQYSYPHLKLAKYYVFLVIAYVFSSTKLDNRAEQVLPGSRGIGGREKRWGKEWGRGARGRNDPNNVYKYE
jgi:hypothetical protein